MPAVCVPVTVGLVRGTGEAGVPVVNVAGHEQSELQYLREEQTPRRYTKEHVSVGNGA